MIVDNMVNRGEDGMYTAEASTLLLKPGEWPSLFETSLGNGQPLIRYSIQLDDEKGGELMWVTYKQVDSDLLLRVFND